MNPVAVPFVHPNAPLQNISAQRSEIPVEVQVHDPVEAKLEEKFTEFVGQTFFGQLMKSMRKTVGKPAYFHGGRAEEIFQGQLDQVMVEDMTKSTAEQFSKPMFELFNLSRQ